MVKRLELEEEVDELKKEEKEWGTDVGWKSNRIDVILSKGTKTHFQKICQ